MVWKDLEQDQASLDSLSGTALLALAEDSDANASGGATRKSRVRPEAGAWLMVVAGKKIGVFQLADDTHVPK